MNKIILMVLALVGLSSASAQQLKNGHGHKMTQEAYDQTIQALDAYLDPIRKTTTDRNQPFYLRDWATPYYLIHKPGTMVRGAVILFHGFTSRPHQFAVLAKYLHEAGFNVWNAGLPNHHLQPNPSQLTAINAEKQWPQEVLVDKYRLPLLKLYGNEVKRALIMAQFNTVLAPGKLPEEQQAKKIGEIQAMLDAELGVENSPKILELKAALENPDDKNYDKYFHAGHRLYIEHAKAHLDRLKALPGPVFSIGLSVGGTVALALAAERPDRIAAAVSYAPLLQTFGGENRLKVKIVGPSNQIPAQNRGAHFNVSSYAATEALGTKVRRQFATKDLDVPVFMVLTDGPWETAADIDASRQFFQGLKADEKVIFEYKPEHRVPHAFVDPRERTTGQLEGAQGQTVTNEYWIGLYRETLRFLVDRTVEKKELGDQGKKEGDADLPKPIDDRTEGFTPDA